MPYITKTMAKYEIDYNPLDASTRVSTQIKYLFEENGFYKTLTRRVRAHFGAKSDAESVTKNVKTNWWWNLKVGALSLVLVASFLAAFFLPGLPVAATRAMGAVAGSSLIMVGFTAMHDASHFALGARDSWKNKFALRVWNSLALWDSGKWLYHHMIRHHSFTGDVNLDPDVIHSRPLVRKHLDADPNQYVGWMNRSLLATTDVYSWITTFVYAAILNNAQMFLYNVVWNGTGELWNMPLEKTAFRKFWWEYALSLGVLAAHVFKGDFYTSLAYFTAASISYGMCILADHDTFESAIENHVDLGEKDWGEIQVRHAADFASNDSLASTLFGELFGSINAQIGHHLYPSVNHVYLKELVPLIRQACEEFDIPYASHGTLLSALLSVSKNFKETNIAALKGGKAE
jgi:fatty acid desaturase